MQLVDAIWADVLSVARLLAVCFGTQGLGGCMCQLSMVLQPKWRELSTNKAVRCENGDPVSYPVSRMHTYTLGSAHCLCSLTCCSAGSMT